jgi:hypothetical protein
MFAKVNTASPAIESDKPLMQLEKLVTRDELAESWGVCPNTIRKLTAEGLLPRVVIPGVNRVLYSPSTIAAFLRRCEGNDL